MAEFLTTPFGIFVTIAAQGLLMAVFLLLSAYFILYADRKIWAAVQMRRGPNVVGAWGLLQSLADMLKLVLKEIVIPAGADRAVFLLAPLLSFTLAMLAWAVIPFSDSMVLSNINVAILFVFAISSLEVYGVIMGGWASNSKYPFLGSLRSAAQMISYEVSIGLIIIGIIISTGSMNFGAIVNAQNGDYGFFSWYWLPHFPMVFLFFISALAETNRPPFDLPEAESELVAGYQVEYSSTPFLLFMAGEYIAIFLMCALVTLLFFGGWLSPVPFLPDSPLWMIAKMAFFFFIFAMVKAIVPRYRYDQLMRLGWKWFLPFSLIWVVFVAFAAKFGFFNESYARWDREPATISAYMEQTCTAEFAALDEGQPALANLLKSQKAAEGVSMSDFARGVVFAQQVNAFLAAVDMSDGSPALKAAASAEDVASLETTTALSSCLVRNEGTVVAGKDLDQNNDVIFSDLLRQSRTALAVKGG